MGLGNLLDNKHAPGQIDPGTPLLFLTNEHNRRVKTQNAGATSMEHEVSAVTRKFKQFKLFEKGHATGGYQHYKGAPNATRSNSCSRCARTHEDGECPATRKRCRNCDTLK